MIVMPVIIPRQDSRVASIRVSCKLLMLDRKSTVVPSIG